MYTWGNGGFGQLGHGTKDSLGAPTHVTGLPGTCLMAACGWSFTVAAMTDGSVYSWGAGNISDDEIRERERDRELGWGGCACAVLSCWIHRCDIIGACWAANS